MSDIFAEYDGLYNANIEDAIFVIPIELKKPKVLEDSKICHTATGDSGTVTFIICMEFVLMVIAYVFESIFTTSILRGLRRFIELTPSLVVDTWVIDAGFVISMIRI